MPPLKGLNFLNRFTKKTLLTTTLDNGVRIASEACPGPCAIGLFVDCGSVYESPETVGVTHLLYRMAFKSTTKQLVRQVEAVGGKVVVSASREHISYMCDGLKSSLPHMVKLLVDSVTNPAFVDEEVKQQLQRVNNDVQQVLRNPHSVLMETIHSAGYQGGLSNSLLAPECAKLNGAVLERFFIENYTAPRMILVAHGIDHHELLEVAVPLLDDLPYVDRPPVPISQYLGGAFYQQVDSSKATCFAIAFEAPGGWLQEKEALTLSVLQTLMGGGFFSTRGSGRLYDRVKLDGFKSFSAFSIIHNRTGIFGIRGTTVSHLMPLAIEVISDELNSVSQFRVSEVELDRAKQATKSAILMNLESRMHVLEDIGRQLLSSGERKPVKHLLGILDEVTLEDLASFTTRLISSPPTLSSYGDVRFVPRYETLKEEFRPK